MPSRTEREGGFLRVTFAADKLSALASLLSADGNASVLFEGGEDSPAGRFLTGMGFGIVREGGGFSRAGNTGDVPADTVVFFDAPSGAGEIAGSLDTAGTVVILVSPAGLPRLYAGSFADEKLNAPKRVVNLNKSDKLRYDIVSGGSAPQDFGVWKCVAGPGCRKRALGLTETDCGRCDVCRPGRAAALEGYGEAEKKLLAMAVYSRGPVDPAEALDVLRGMRMKRFVNPFYGALRGVPEGRIVEALCRLANAGLVRFERGDRFTAAERR